MDHPDHAASAADAADADHAAYADLPRADDVLDRLGAEQQRWSRPVVRRTVRAALSDARSGIGSDLAADRRPVVPDADAVAATVAAALSARLQPGPRRVINAAGVIVHTNLGRAPLSAAAVTAMVDAAGYCDLEMDLDSGRRGSRGSHVDALLAAATGAEDAIVVNSCAAALVLALAALAAGRDVPVSRGHLVEIGGSFRLPEVMAASGARLLEVGTTNRTRAADYRVHGDVAAILTVHPSNFTQDGFVETAPLAEVAAVAAERGVPLLHDAGAGLLARPADGPLAAESSLAEDLAAGADVVLASGDKLLGGPQAGLLAGRADLVERCRRHPLARAVRVDKLRLAALNATLRQHLAGEAVPVLAALADDPPAQESLARRTAALAERTGGVVVGVRTMIGGGSAPGAGVEGPGVRLDPPVGGDAGRVAAALRAGETPVLARVHDGALLLDLRTVAPQDDEVIVRALAAAGWPATR